MSESTFIVQACHLDLLLPGGTLPPLCLCLPVLWLGGAFLGMGDYMIVAAGCGARRDRMQEASGEAGEEGVHGVVS